MKRLLILIVLIVVGNCLKDNFSKCQTIRNTNLTVAKDQRETVNCDDEFLREKKNTKSFVRKNNFDEVTSLLMATSALKNEKCRKDLLRFLEEFKNSTPWAVEMFDASSKFPVGLVSVNTYQFGNYDQCLNVYSSKDLIRGKYCLASIEFSPQMDKYLPFYEEPSENEFSLDYDLFKSVFEKFKVTKDVTKKKRNLFYTGICTPHSCDSEDLKTLLYNTLQPDNFRYNVSIYIPDESCSTNELQSVSTEGKILMLCILIVVFGVLFCTLWEFLMFPQSKTKSKLHPYIQAFSMSSNLKKFSMQQSDQNLNIFNGMKCLSMMLIIMGHRCMASCGGPFMNPQFLEERYRKFQNIFLLNGTLIVDTFFLISGFLTFLILYRGYKNHKKLNPFKIYFYRWLRTAPVYILMVFFYAYVFEYIGNGPMWAAKVKREAERCRKSWWTNFLFINNYVNTDSLCMFQSWYVTCDMHFTLLAPFIVHLVAKSPRKGISCLIFLILASLSINFVLTLYKKYDGVLRLFITTFEDLASSPTFKKVYIKTHHRVTPYLSGMMAAYIYILLKKKNYKFSLKEVWIYSVIAVACGLSAICGAWLFYIPGRKYNALENALYASFHRLLWALSMSWIAVAGGRKAFGILEPCLSQKFFMTFSKLSYSTFLVHGVIQIYMSSTLKVPEYMSFSKLYWMTCGDVALSFLFAFLLYIFLEAPIKGTLTLLFFRKKIKR